MPLDRDRESLAGGPTEWFNATGARAGRGLRGSTRSSTLVGELRHRKENMPRVQELRDARAGEGLRVVAVHMPRYEADTDAEAVRDAVTTYGITEPCAVDNQHALRDAFQNEQGYVPAYYLFDPEGKLRCFAAGENGLRMVLPAVERVLAAASREGAAKETTA